MIIEPQEIQPEEIAETVTPTGETDVVEAQDSTIGGERLFTQADLDRVVADRLRRAKKATPAPEKPKATFKEQTTDIHAELEEMKTLRRFDRAVGSMPLDDARRDALETLFKVERPENPSEWAKQKAELFGWNKQPTPTPTPTSPTQPKTLPVGAKPVTDQTAPAPDRSGYTEADDPLSWSPETIARIVAEKGAVAGRKYLRQKFEEAMGGERRLTR